MIRAFRVSTTRLYGWSFLPVSILFLQCNQWQQFQQKLKVLHSTGSFLWLPQAAAVDRQSVIRSVPAFQIDLINSPTYNKWSISGWSSWSSFGIGLHTILSICDRSRVLWVNLDHNNDRIKPKDRLRVSTERLDLHENCISPFLFYTSFCAWEGNWNLWRIIDQPIHASNPCRWPMRSFTRNTCNIHRNGHWNERRTPIHA